MTNNESESNLSKTPRYTIANIMKLLNLDEPKVRKLIKRAGIDIDELKSDPSELIRYKDFRLLWLSVANRRIGRLLATLLVEEPDNWFFNLFRKRR